MSRLLLVLISALLLAQLLGSIHRIVHAPGGVDALVRSAALVAGIERELPVGEAPGGRWFGGHAAIDCAAMDHALQPAPIATASVLSASGPFLSPPLRSPTGIAATGHGAAFLARGPPPLLSRFTSV